MNFFFFSSPVGISCEPRTCCLGCWAFLGHAQFLFLFLCCRFPITCLFNLVILLFLEIKSHVSQAGLKLSVYEKVVLDSCSFCLHLLSAGQSSPGCMHARQSSCHRRHDSRPLCSVDSFSYLLPGPSLSVPQALPLLTFRNSRLKLWRRL